MPDIHLTQEQYAVVCGLVAPTSDVHHPGIFTEEWPTLRRIFPLADFEHAVEHGIVAYDDQAGL